MHPALRATRSLPEGYEVFRTYSSSFCGFVLTTIEGLIFLERIAIQMSMEVDFIADQSPGKGDASGTTWDTRILGNLWRHTNFARAISVG